MERRALLSSMASIAILSGCNSSNRGTTTANNTTSPSTTRKTTTTTSSDKTTATTLTTRRVSIGEPVDTAEGTIRVYDPSVVRGAVTLDPYYHLQVVATPSGQFLIFSIVSSMTNLQDKARAATDLKLDSTKYQVSPYAFPPTDNGIQLGFQIPMDVTPENGSIRWSSSQVEVEWDLDDSTLEQLRNPAKFVVHAFSVPDVVESFQPFDVKIELENVGVGDGTFTAEIGVARSDDGEIHRWPISKGVRKTVITSAQVDGNSGEERTIYLDWGLDKLTRNTTIKS